MNCSQCGHPESVVVDSRTGKGHRRRRRQCVECGERWSTREVVADSLAEARGYTRLLVSEESFSQHPEREEEVVSHD